jgi:hypothetical protein
MTLTLVENPESTMSTSNISTSNRKNICSSQMPRKKEVSLVPISNPHSTEAISEDAVVFKNQSSIRQIKITIEAKNIVTANWQKKARVPKIINRRKNSLGDRKNKFNIKT